MDNQTTVSIKFANSITGQAKLEKYAQTLKVVNSVLGGMNQGQSKVLEKAANDSKDMGNNIRDIGSRVKFAFNFSVVRQFGRAIFSAAKGLAEFTKSSSDYIENVNLLEVAYKRTNESVEESSATVKEFISTMSEVYGFDESRLTKSLGIFKQLANAMKLPTETGENLSELMVKMTNDIASLYNLDLTRAENALQSALVGQTRPIRGATGADITESTLQQTLDQLSIQRNIRDLSFAEKRLIMVVSLTQQLKNSQGDYARTIESTSNQIRVMQEQWARLGRAVGNIFYPILQKILPYVNAILMVMVEIANLVANLFGFEMPEFDYSGLSSTSDATSDLIEGMDGASDSTDKLSNKLKSLRGFDKLNVINTPSDSNSGGTTNGIDNSVLDAFNDSFSSYNDMMDSVRMRANDIRDSMLDWLGLTDRNYGKLKLLASIFKPFQDAWDNQGKPVMDGFYDAFTELNNLSNDILTSIIEVWTNGSGQELIETFLKTLGNILFTLGKIGEAFDNAWNDEGKGTKIIQDIADGLNEVGGIIKGVTDTVKIWWSGDGQRIADAVTKVIGTISGLFKEVGQVMSDVWNNGGKELFGNLLKFGGEAIILISNLMPVLSVLGSVLLQYVVRPVKTLLDIFNSFMPILNSIINFVNNIFAGKWDEAFKGLGNIVINLLNYIKDKFNKLFKVVLTPINILIDGWNATLGNIAGKIKPLKIEIPDIPPLALGGLPDAGQLFIANERGPELVGNIGGQSFVANQSQMMDLLDKKLNGSGNGLKNTTFIIQVGTEEIGKIVLKDLENMAKSNGEPIVIGG